MKATILLLLFQTCLLSLGQMLENTEGQNFGDKPNFVEDFIRKNSIYFIQGYYSTKASLDYIRESNDIHLYKFNQIGELTLEYKVQAGDTLVTIYVYDERGNKIIVRKSDQYGFHSYHFRYDNLNRVIYSEYRRDVNRGQNKLTFEPDESLVVTKETFEYVAMDGNDYKKIYYNNSGIMYKEEFFYFDANKLLVKQEGVLKNGSGRTSITYSYDNNGRLIEKYAESLVMGNYSSKYIYEYDEFGNILSIQFYRNGQYTTEYQLLYDTKTSFLKATITRDHATNFMTILSFKDYTFFN